MADKHPETSFFGFDVFEFYPTIHPANCHCSFSVSTIDEANGPAVVIQDLDDPGGLWDVTYQSDFIHVRGMNGSIRDWPQFYNRCHQALKLGGWIEIGGHNFRILSNELKDANTDRPTTEVARMNQYLRDVLTAVGRPIRMAHEHARGLTEAGFDSIKQERHLIKIGS